MHFAKEVKKRLIDLDKDTRWLIEEVRSKTGMFLDAAYLSRIFKGERNAPKIKAAIAEILELEGIL